MVKPTVQQPSNPLFTNGEDASMNACVGDNGGPYDLYAYARGFFLSGEATVRAAKEDGISVDLVVYPAVFSYRHGIELYLKGISRLLSYLDGRDGAYSQHHRLQDLWNSVREAHDRLADPLVEATTLTGIHEAIEHFAEIDPTGEVFRYPENRLGQRHLLDYKLINLLVLRDSMSTLEGALDQLKWQADDRLSYLRDAVRDGAG